MIALLFAILAVRYCGAVCHPRRTGSGLTWLTLIVLPTSLDRLGQGPAAHYRKGTMMNPVQDVGVHHGSLTVGDNNELRALIPEAIEVVGKTINVNRVKGRFRSAPDGKRHRPDL